MFFFQNHLSGFSCFKKYLFIHVKKKRRMQVFVLTCSLRQTIDFYSMQAKPIEPLHSIQTKIEQTIDWTEIIHLLYVHQTKILLWLQVQKAGLQISKILIFSRKCCLYVFFLLISKSTWCSVAPLANECESYNCQCGPVVFRFVIPTILQVLKNVKEFRFCPTTSTFIITLLDHILSC